MEQLKDEITLANKFNLIKLVYGKCISENIFDSNISDEELNIILAKIKALKNINLKYHNYISEVYFKNNEDITTEDNELTYNIVFNKLYFASKNILAYNQKVKKDEYIIPSYSKYDNKAVYENLDIIVNNYFIVRVKKIIEENNEKLDKKSLEIIINKPSIAENTINLINKIIN